MRVVVEIKMTISWIIVIKIIVYNIKCIAFCCVATGIPRFDQKKAAKLVLTTVRLWLEANHSSIDCFISCLYENAEYKIYVVRCVIWYHLYNLKNLKNTYGGVLILVKLQAEATWCFSLFLNCTNGTKSRNAPRIKI